MRFEVGDLVSTMVSGKGGPIRHPGRIIQVKITNKGRYCGVYFGKPIGRLWVYARDLRPYRLPIEISKGQDVENDKLEDPGP